MQKNSIIIGNAGGFWGDDFDAFRKQLEGGKLHYLTLDYLAEVTMSILRKQQLKNPGSGYCTVIISAMENKYRNLSIACVSLLYPVILSFSATLSNI